jgi:hypothetical protein
VYDASEPKITPDPSVLMGTSPARCEDRQRPSPVARACVSNPARLSVR